jgi:hypothetical protein
LSRAARPFCVGSVMCWDSFVFFAGGPGSRFACERVRDGFGNGIVGGRISCTAGTENSEAGGIRSPRSTLGCLVVKDKMVKVSRRSNELQTGKKVLAVEAWVGWSVRR